MAGVAKAGQQLSVFRRMLANAEIPEDAIKVGAGAAGIETVMRKAGLYKPEALRPARELWLDSRCILGRLLDKEINPSRPEKTSQKLLRLKLDRTRASESQRMGKMPDKDRAIVYDGAAQQEILPTVEMVLRAARPFWQKANRGVKHKTIAAAAKVADFGNLGPFPLLYADPPTKFATHSENGLGRSPDQHYPTLSWDEIADFKIGGLFVSEIAMKNAALFMWCTSSNIHHALKVMEAWDFEFKSSAVWVKMPEASKLQLGTGFVFRNAHEILLYGTRGNIPAPQYQPPSVFFHPRGAHSAKPPEIRKVIEKMYPDFEDERTRCELFARGEIKGWTSHGLEAT